MANTFSERVTRFTPLLDRAYFKEALTAFLERPNTEFIGANTIKRPILSMDGAAEYSRSDGYVSGSLDVSYGEYTLEFDRGRSFIIDVLDDDESGFNLYADAAMEYVRTKEIPEMDATRFSRFSAAANTVVESDTIDPLSDFDAAQQALDDLEVPDEGRIAFVSNEFYHKLKQDLQSSGRWSMDTMELGDANAGTNINRKIAVIDGVTFVKVPPKRFWDVVETLDGTTAGQESGGFQPESGTSKALHLVMAHAPALEAYTKRSVNKIISPELNQTHDAWKIAYRMHHDGIVATNKQDGIYVLKNATATT